MRILAPSYGVFATVANVLSYLQDNKDNLWKMIKYYAPFIAVVTFLNACFDLIPIIPEDKSLLAYIFGVKIITQLALGWIMTCFLISWHRLVIQGTYPNLAHPLKPDRSVFRFLGYGFLLFLFSTILISLPIAMAFAFSGFIKVTAGILAIIAGVISIYISTRCSIIFPAIASGEKLTLYGAFKMARGYFLKISLSGFCITLVVLIPFFLLLILGSIAFGLISAILFLILSSIAGEAAITTAMMPISGSIGLIAQLISNIIIAPVCWAVGATSITNFYMHAVENNNRENA